MQLSHKPSFHSFFLIEAPQYAQHCDGGQSRHGSCSQVATSLAYTGHHSSFFLSPKHQDMTQQRAYHRNRSKVKHKTSHFLACLAFHAMAYAIFSPHGLPSPGSPLQHLQNHLSHESPGSDSPNEGQFTFLSILAFPLRPHPGNILFTVRTITNMVHGSLSPSLPPSYLSCFLLSFYMKEDFFPKGYSYYIPGIQLKLQFKKIFFFSLHQFVLPKIILQAGMDWDLKWGLSCLVFLHYLSILFTLTWANGLINYDN